MVVTSALVGQLITRTGRVNIFPQMGLSLATVAFLALAASVTIAATPVILGLTMLVGVGLGMVMPPTQVAVQFAAGRDSLGRPPHRFRCRDRSAALSALRERAPCCSRVARSACGWAGGSAPSGDRRRSDGGGSACGTRGAALSAHLDAAYRVVFVVLAMTTLCGAAIARTVPRLEWAKPTQSQH
jgi:hypothetical protein